MEKLRIKRAFGRVTLRYHRSLVAALHNHNVDAATGLN